ncbi:MAG: hypothetical protein GF346_03370 [Candidatus Eisenbacteria bacterium]|nr:hypothetical protein [Candidatus Latescibacterota bacterium]MBD3301462.1 hypothetical protein [Candidatus Eisenbacteria bacterium]
MKTDVVPTDLLAHADLLLWAVEGLRPEGPAAPRPATVEELDELARRTGIAESWPGKSLKALRDRFALLLPEIRAAERTRLFEADPVCPINETAYIRRDKGAILADLIGFYTAFGHRPKTDTGEKPDHLLIEIEFVAVLLALLARAIAAEETDNAAVTARALSSFSRDHLGDWIGPFCARLALTAEGTPFADTSRLLEAAWISLVDRLDLAPPERPADPFPRDEEGTPYECGLCREDEPSPEC